MAAKATGRYSKIGAVLFTSLVAPVIVNMTITAIKVGDYRSQSKEQAPEEKHIALVDNSFTPVIYHTDVRPTQARVDAGRTEQRPLEIPQIIVREPGKSPPHTSPRSRCRDRLHALADRLR